MDLSRLIIQAWCAHMHVGGKEVLVLDVYHQEIIEYPSSTLSLSFFSRDILWQNGRKHKTIPHVIVAEHKLIVAGTLRDACITRQEEKRVRHCAVQRVSIHAVFRTPGLHSLHHHRKKRNQRKVRGCIIFHSFFVIFGVDLSGSFCLFVYYFCLSSLRIRTSVWWMPKGRRHQSVPRSYVSYLPLNNKACSVSSDIFCMQVSHRLVCWFVKLPLGVLIQHVDCIWNYFKILLYRPL